MYIINSITDLSQYCKLSHSYLELVQIADDAVSLLQLRYLLP